MTKKYELPPFLILKVSFLPSGMYSADFVAEIIGGKVKHNYDDPKQDYSNTCALRVSRALNYSGALVRPSVASVRVNSGKDKRWYIYGVRDMERYLRHMYGRPDVEKKGKSNGSVAESEFAGRQGIILFKNYHVDLWNGGGCEGHCYFGSVNEVMLWETPPIRD